jgi:hypothetical protein
VSRTINALKAGDLQRGLAAVRKDIEALNADLTGANSEPVKAGAKVFVRNWRRIVSVRGRGEPSPPGSPPHAQLRRLVRSIGTTVVGGVRRVGSSLFTSRLQEFGFTAEDGTAVAPRPHARPALEQSAPEMVDVTVSEAHKRIRKQ